MQFNGLRGWCLLSSLLVGAQLCAAADLALNTLSARKSALDSITVKDLRGHVAFLADDTLEGRASGTNGGRAAGGYLIEQLRKLGVAPAMPGKRYDQPFDGTLRNIIGVIEGSDPVLRDEYILIGAHYDHVGYGTRKNSNGPIGYIHNGADDNASGTAALLELVQAIRNLPIAPKRSLIIAFWDGEEINLLGSKHWLKNPTIPLTKLKAAINLDMVGRLRNEQVEVYGTRTAAGWRRMITDANAVENPLKLNYTWEMKADSDHHPFFEAKIPVMMLHTGLHELYHKPTDDIETLNFEGMDRVAKLLFEIVYVMADELPLSAFRDESRTETPETKLTRERALPPIPGRLGIRWSDREPEGTGLPLTSVTTGGPAAKAGLRVGDRMIAINGRTIPSNDVFRRWILAAPAETTVTIERNGESEPKELPLKLAGDPLRWGISWRADDADPGVLFLNRVVVGTSADTAGVRAGDRIDAVDDRRFADQDEFEKFLLADTLRLRLERDGKYRTVELKALEFPKAE